MFAGYKTWIFDCDGVLLDSNQVKTQAMWETAKPFGESEASRLVAYHKANGGVMTVALNRRPLTINFGVVDALEGNQIRRYVEKPTLDYLVGMGICVLDPAVAPFIERGGRMDLPDLIAALLDAGKSVVGWETDAYWLDIGRPDDYERAQSDYERLKERFGGKV